MDHCGLHILCSLVFTFKKQEQDTHMHMPCLDSVFRKWENGDVSFLPHYLSIAFNHLVSNIAARLGT